MPNGSQAFTIDDHKSVEDNLTTFATDLETIDAELAAVLKPMLGEWGRDKQVDNGALLNALFAATAPTEGLGA